MQKVLVLNFDYSPLNVTTLRRGFILVNNGKAEIIKSAENPIITFTKTYIRPLIIRLLKYINYRSKGIRINRHRVFKRDNNECVYCTSKKDLTIDHVTPRSRGGKNTWDNLTTCCKKCNAIKDNKTPSQANLTMRHKPYNPSYVQLIKKTESMHETWGNYLFN